MNTKKKHPKKKIVKKKNVLYNENWSNFIGCYLKPNWYYETLDVEGYSSWGMNNHPLVKKGLGFWDGYKLVIGYKLINNDNIFRPIWSKEREQMLSVVRVELDMYSRFYAADFREKMIYNILLDVKNIEKIPEVILRKISKLTYDPYMLD